MKLVATRKSEQNRALVDPWTAVHLAAGLAAGLTRTPWVAAASLAVAYEALEQFAERRKAGQRILETSGPESIPNAVLDVAVFLVGHHLGELWNRTGDDG